MSRYPYLLGIPQPYLLGIPSRLGRLGCLVSDEHFFDGSLVGYERQALAKVLRRLEHPLGVSSLVGIHPFSPLLDLLWQ